MPLTGCLPARPVRLPRSSEWLFRARPPEIRASVAEEVVVRRRTSAERCSSRRRRRAGSRGSPSISNTTPSTPSSGSTEHTICPKASRRSVALHAADPVCRGRRSGCRRAARAGWRARCPPGSSSPTPGATSPSVGHAAQQGVETRWPASDALDSPPVGTCRSTDVSTSRSPSKRVKPQLDGPGLALLAHLQRGGGRAGQLLLGDLARLVVGRDAAGADQPRDQHRGEPGTARVPARGGGSAHDSSAGSSMTKRAPSCPSARSSTHTAPPCRRMCSATSDRPSPTPSMPRRCPAELPRLKRWKIASRSSSGTPGPVVLDRDQHGVALACAARRGWRRRRTWPRCRAGWR